MRVERVSDYIVTKPYGGVEQDDFLNAVLCVKTLRTPHELLDRLHEIEQAAHRTREIHWGRAHWIWIFCSMMKNCSRMTC